MPIQPRDTKKKKRKEKKKQSKKEPTNGLYSAMVDEILFEIVDVRDGG